MMARLLRTLRVLRARFREIDLNSRIDVSFRDATETMKWTHPTL